MESHLCRRGRAAAFAGLAIAVAAGSATACTTQRRIVRAIASAAAPPCPLRLGTRPHRATLSVPILMYHRIGIASPSAPEVSRRLTVHPADFSAQMRWLQARGYRSVTQRELFGALECGLPLGPRPVLITFDDGYRDVFFHASTVLSRLGLHATAYVISDRISNGDPSFLTWPLLRALEQRGVEIGSHTASHADLTQLDDSSALDELERSRRVLERRLGHRVPWLAYPFGAVDTRVERLASRAGYVLAMTTRGGVEQDGGRPLALRRLRVLDTTGAAGLAAILGGAAHRP